MADQTSPIQQIQSATNVATRLNENFDAASPAMLYGRDATSTTGLTWGYVGGRFGSVLIASGIVTLTASSTNHVVAARADGVVTSLVASTNWDDETDYIRLYKVTAGAAAVTGYEDHRQAIGGGGGGAIVAADITDSTAVGRAVLTAVDAAAARTAIGAGTGNGTSDFSGAYADLTGKPTLGTAAALNVAASGDAAAGEVVKGNDTRLSGGAGMTNPMTTVGDIITGGAAGAPTRLAATTNGYVLTLASGVPVWAASAGGGGGVTGFTTSLVTASPNAATNASVLAASGGSTNQDFVLSAKGTGAILAQTPDSGVGGGNKRGNKAVDFQTTRSAASQVASGSNSFVGSGLNNMASNNNCAVVAGSGNAAEDANCAVVAGSGNVTRGAQSIVCAGNLNSNSYASAYSFIGAGRSNSTEAENCFVGGGQGNAASGTQASIVGGASHTASGTRSFVGGGQSNIASGTNSFVPGGYGATTRGLYGCSAHSAGLVAGYGDSQTCVFVQMANTTSATALTMGSNNNAGAAENYIVLPNNSAYTFDALVTARNQSGGDSASFRVSGCVKRGGSAASTALVGTPVVTALGADASAASWSAAAVVNTTTGYVGISVTGESGKTIRWVARVVTVEIVG